MGRKRPNSPDVEARITPDHPLAGLIADAYRVFRADGITDLGVCRNCCMYPEIEQDFLNHKAEDLPLHYLQDRFFAAADYPHVPKAVWVHLLPRIMEVLICGSEPASVGIEVSLNRFPTGDPGQWTSDQWDVLRRLCTAFLDCYQDPKFRDEYLDDVLCALARADFSLDDMLDQIWRWPDEILAGRLAHDWHTAHGMGSVWITSFWEGDLTGRTFSWYTSQALYDRMVAFGCAESTSDLRSQHALFVADTIRTHADWSDT